MIPYFQYTQFMVGPLTIHVWGLMVAIGILVGLWVMKRTARKLNLNPAPFEEAAFWILLSAFVGARVSHFLFYRPLEEFAGVFRIWEGGWSSMGGIVAGSLAALAIMKMDPRLCGDDGRYARAADILLSGFPIGMAIGRIGCFLIHDHPGTLSNFILAVKFPDGARHDLGLYESLAMFVLAAALALAAQNWRGRSTDDRHSNVLMGTEGRLAGVTIAAYALIRFPLDFLRVGDTRYFGLTAAQYGCLVLISAVVMFRVAQHDKRVV